MLNKMNRENHHWVLDKLMHEFLNRMDSSKVNTWLTMPKMHYNFVLACLGIEPREPVVRFEEDRMVV